MMLTPCSIASMPTCQVKSFVTNTLGSVSPASLLSTNNPTLSHDLSANSSGYLSQSAQALFSLRQTYSFFIEDTTNLVNCGVSACHAPHAPGPLFAMFKRVETTNDLDLVWLINKFPKLLFAIPNDLITVDGSNKKKSQSRPMMKCGCFSPVRSSTPKTAPNNALSPHHQTNQRHATSPKI